MRSLHKKVNIVPVVAKSDTLTPDEVAAFKKRVQEEIALNEIQIYTFPIDEDDDEETQEENRQLQAAVPFAVIGSNTVIEVGGHKVRGRQYPWGVVEVENEAHSDFTKLRNMLIRTHMQDLKDTTNDILYENFRAEKLSKLSGANPNPEEDSNPLDRFEKEKQRNQAKLQKMEEEMKQVFENKVKEKETKLHATEAELEKKHKEEQARIDQEKKELEQMQSQHEAEKNEFALEHKALDKKKGSRIF
eukprot:Colp12_sorted_trinity150504_noHs@17741